MGYQVKKFFFGLIATSLVIGAWLWATAEEFEEETTKPEWVVPDRFKEKETVIVDEDEPIRTIKEPPPQYGWVYPPPPVRKAAGKIKKKLKPKTK